MPAFVPQVPPAPAQAPTAPVLAGSPGVAGGTPLDPTDVYRGLRAQRSILRDQLSQLESTRLSIASRLRQGKVDGADRAGLEGRLQELDKQISNVDQQIAVNEQALAKAAAVPGTSTQDPNSFINENNGPNAGEIMVTSIAITGVLLFPVMLAWARRIWKRSSTAVAQLPSDLVDRFTRFEHSLDSIAIEIERVSEGQRWVTKLLSERGQPAIGAGAAQPVEVRQGEKVPSTSRS